MIVGSYFFGAPCICSACSRDGTEHTCITAKQKLHMQTTQIFRYFRLFLSAI